MPEKFVNRTERSRRRDEIFKYRRHRNAGNNSRQIKDDAERGRPRQAAEHKITDDEREHHDDEHIIAKIKQRVFEPDGNIAAGRGDFFEKIIEVVQRPIPYLGLECQKNGIEVDIQPENKPVHDGHKEHYDEKNRLSFSLRAFEFFDFFATRNSS